MSDEKLPPEGFELGDLWCIDRKRGVYYNRDEGIVSLGDPEQAKRAGAIVRKAEAPTIPVCCPRGCLGLNGRHEVFCPGNAEVIAANAAIRPAEQPSGNTGGFPALGPVALHDAVSRAVAKAAEAPAAPVRGSLWTTPAPAPGAPIDLKVDASVTAEDIRSAVEAAGPRVAAFSGKAPAAPVAEPTELDGETAARMLDEAIAASGGRVRIEAPREWLIAALHRDRARIAALEAELAEAKELLREGLLLDWQERATAFLDRLNMK